MLTPTRTIERATDADDRDPGASFPDELIMPCGTLVHDADRGSEHRETCSTCLTQPYTATPMEGSEDA